MNKSQEHAENLHRSLLAFRELTENWNSYGAQPPNEKAISIGEAIFSHLIEQDLLPDRIVPSVEGGLAFVFLFGELYADIECFNDGDILIGFCAPSMDPKVKEALINQIEEEIEDIRSFLVS